MEHSQERKASEEVLRLIIQKMAPQPAAFTPATYAVWYEHVTGINPGLDQAIRAVQQQGKPFDDAAISQLYGNHVSEARWATGLMRESMQQVLAQLLEATSQSDQQAQQFGSSLLDFGKQLRANPAPAVLNELVVRMRDEASVMHSSVSELHTQMHRCKSEVQRLQQELENARKEALIDPLTGVYNRRGFELQVQQLLADTAQIDAGACLLMLDIDHFKSINDTYGHLLGDKVIHTLANTFKALVKGQDSVCRLGGEEFAILLPETSAPGAAQLAEHIRRNIELGRIKSPVSDVHIEHITVSIGVAAYQHGNNLIQWMDMADQALYQSKQGGRNRVTVHAA